jgi:hypothetical protein
MGFGAVWTAVYPDQARGFRGAFHTRDTRTCRALNFIPVGLPSGKDKTKDKFDQKRIHKDRW